MLPASLQSPLSSPEAAPIVKLRMAGGGSRAFKRQMRGRAGGGMPNWGNVFLGIVSNIGQGLAEAKSMW